MIKANYKETGDSVRVVHLGLGEGQRGTQQSYIRGALLPNIQLPCHWQQNTKNQSHKLPENTNALILTETCQTIITCTGTCMSLCFVILYFVCTWYISRYDALTKYCWFCVLAIWVKMWSNEFGITPRISGSDLIPTIYNNIILSDNLILLV